MNKKWIKLIGNGLMVAALLYVIWQLWESRESLHQAFHGPEVILASIVVTLVYTGVVCCNALAYVHILHTVCGQSVGWRYVMPLYLKSNLYKYLPGNVMHYVGRNQIALDTNTSHAEVALASLLEIGLMVAATFSGGLLFSAKYIFQYALDFISFRMIVFLGIAALCLIGVILIFFRKRLSELFARAKMLLQKNNLIRLALVFLLLVVNFTVSGAIVLSLLVFMGATIAPSQYLAVTGISIFAWLIGFLTPGAPAGLGVREAMLSILLAGVVPQGLLAAVALIYRVITLLGDILSFLLFHLITKNKSSKKR